MSSNAPAAEIAPGIAAKADDGFQAGAVATIAGTHTLHDTYAGFLPPLIPLFIQSLGISKAEAGLLDVFMRWPSLLQPLVGYLADRVSLRYVVILAPAITTTLMSWIGLVPSYALLIVLMLTVGTSSAAFHAVASPMAGRLSGRSLGRGMSFWMVGGELGRGLGPVVVVTALRFLGLRGMPWLAILGVLMSASLYVLLRNVQEPRLIQQGTPTPLGATLRRVAPVMLPVAAILAARAMMESAVTTFLPTLLTEQGSSLWSAGFSLTALQLAALPGVLASGYLSDRLGRRLVLLLSSLIPALLILLFLATNGWVRLPILILLGMTLLTATPVFMALVQERFAENRALANSIFVSSYFIIRAIGLVGVGALGDRVGLIQAFTISAFIGFLGVPLVWLLPRGGPQRT